MIEIVPYRPGWAAEFQSIAAALGRGLRDVALRIDHVGSTAVPGLCAKDVIDIQITVAQLGATACDRLRRLGFEQHADILGDHVPPGHAEAEGDWMTFFITQPPAQRRVHLHVRAAGRPNQRYALLFRDYLIEHAAAATAYGELKRRLARVLADEAGYADVKDPAVDLIHLAAEAWAVKVGWALPRDGS